MQTPTTNSSIPAALLIRVSTTRQETSRQIHELQAVAVAKGWEVLEICEETISGSADLKDRPALQRILELSAGGSIRKVLVHEISRLARRPSVALTFVEALEAHRVSLYWHAHNIETLLPSGKRNPAAAIMLALLAEMARSEKDTLRERVISGLQEARRRGKTLGRPKNSCLGDAEFLQKHRRVVRHLREGQSIRNAATICRINKNTALKVRHVLQRFEGVA